MSCMIEHRIKDHPDASLMAKPHQLFGFFQRTESWVNLQIIFGIVLMVGRGREQRCEIKKRHAQILEIGNLLCDAFDVSTKMILCGGSRPPGC